MIFNFRLRICMMEMRIIIFNEIFIRGVIKMKNVNGENYKFVVLNSIMVYFFTENFYPALYKLLLLNSVS